MIELTEQQVQALQHADTTPPRVVNPQTQEAFVLLRVEGIPTPLGRRIRRQSLDKGGASGLGLGADQGRGLG